MRKLVVNTDYEPSVPQDEQLRCIAEAGWDGVFVGWKGTLKPVAQKIREYGLYFQSVHAPYCEVDRLWEAYGEEGEAELARQIRCLEDSVSVGVTLVVMHAIIGMDRSSPTQLGIDRYGILAERARALGVRIALENTEGEVYLEALLNALKGEKHVGFCIDTGHELCYNGGKDLIGKYAERVFCTHLNDNMGQTGETITWYDDAHMLPFDGVADWRGIAARLVRAGYTGDLTFEFVKGNRPERTANDRYLGLSFGEYARLARGRAERFAALVG